jgi:hypothetical protein
MSSAAAAGVEEDVPRAAAVPRVPDALAVEAEELVRGKYHQFLSTQVALANLVRRGAPCCCAVTADVALFIAQDSACRL